MNKIPSNITDELPRYSESIGAYESDRFYVNCFNEFIDLKMESPIEMLFYMAFKAVGEINNLFHETGVSCDIKPQIKIGKYRVDFIVSKIHWEKEETTRKAIVECDGTSFHDRTEFERRNEKQRDRWLQSEGWKILHFTGKEIIEDSALVAAEVLAYLSGENKQDLYDVYALYGEVGNG